MNKYTDTIELASLLTGKGWLSAMEVKNMTKLERAKVYSKLQVLLRNKDIDAERMRVDGITKYKVNRVGNKIELSKREKFIRAICFGEAL